jgi:hypothetical protein
MYQRDLRQCPVWLLYRTYRETTGRSGTKSGTGWHSDVRVCSCCLGTVFHRTLLLVHEVPKVTLGDLDATVTEALLQAVD